jgi:hypothetical protein
MPEEFIEQELADFLSARSLGFKLPIPEHPMDPPLDDRRDIAGRISQWWSSGQQLRSALLEGKLVDLIVISLPPSNEVQAALAARRLDAYATLQARHAVMAGKYEEFLQEAMKLTQAAKIDPAAAFSAMAQCQVMEGALRDVMGQMVAAGLAAGISEEGHGDAVEEIKEPDVVQPHVPTHVTVSKGELPDAFLYPAKSNVYDLVESAARHQQPPPQGS